MLNRFNADIPPAWHAILIDETNYYLDEDFVSRCGGKIHGVYLANLNSRIYCCEITPSHELHLVGSVPEEWPEGEGEREDVYDALSEGDANGNQVVYYHCRAIDALPKDRKRAVELDEDEWRNVDDNGYETVLEAYRGSPAFG